MGEYAAMTDCPRGYCEEAEALCRDALALGLAEEGLHPAGEPRAGWHKITRQEADPAAGLRAGDWQVQVVVDVAEDPPVSG
jgi:hypothetical protein